jgi:hypothetical protein
MKNGKQRNLTALLTHPDGKVYGGDEEGNLFCFDENFEKEFLVNFNADKRQPAHQEQDDFTWYVSRLCLAGQKIIALSESDNRIMCYDPASNSLSEIAQVHTAAGMDSCPVSGELFVVGGSGIITIVGDGLTETIPCIQEGMGSARDLRLSSEYIYVGLDGCLQRIHRKTKKIEILAQWEQRDFELLDIFVDSEVVVSGVGGAYYLQLDGGRLMVDPAYHKVSVGAQTFVHNGQTYLAVTKGEEISVYANLGADIVLKQILPSGGWCFAYRKGCLIVGLESGDLEKIELSSI